jgi:hypothetical protein
VYDLVDERSRRGLGERARRPRKPKRAQTQTGQQSLAPADHGVSPLGCPCPSQPHFSVGCLDNAFPETLNDNFCDPPHKPVLLDSLNGDNWGAFCPTASSDYFSARNG